MTQEAIRLGLHQSRAAARPGPVNGLARLLVHVEDVHTIRYHPGDVVGGRALGDVLHLLVDAPRSGLGVLVVLADEHHGQVPHGRHVHALVEGPGVAAAVPEECHRHPIAAPHLLRQARARGDGDAGAHDAVGPQDP